MNDNGTPGGAVFTGTLLLGMAALCGCGSDDAVPGAGGSATPPKASTGQDLPGSDLPAMPFPTPRQVAQEAGGTLVDTVFGDGEDRNKGNPKSLLPADVPWPGKPKLPSLKPTDVTEGVFRMGQDALRGADRIGQEVLAMDVDEEMKWGKRMHECTLQRYKLADGDGPAQRLRKLAQPFLDDRSRKEIEYQFFALDDEQVHSFALPGGYIYVCKGMLDFVGSDAELEFLLANAIAHVDLRHCVEMLTYQARVHEATAPIAGQIAGLTYNVIAAGYKKDRYFEADAWAFRQLVKRGRSREECLRLLRHLQQRAAALGSAEPVDKPDSVWGVVQHEAQTYFKEHPPMPERIARLEALDVAPAAAAKP